MEFGLRISLLSLSLNSAASLFAAEPNGASDLPPSSLKPPRGEIVPGFWEQHGAFIILGGILLLVLVGVGIWLLLRPKPPVPVSWAVQARQELESLRQQPEDGALLSKTSQILRGYIAAAFDLPREELTTSEFCRLLVQNHDTGPELSGEISEFLRACDVRKFAPLAQPQLGAIARCLAIIDRAEARLAELKRSRDTASDPAAKRLDRSGRPEGMTSGA